MASHDLSSTRLAKVQLKAAAGSTPCFLDDEGLCSCDNEIGTVWNSISGVARHLGGNQEPLAIAIRGVIRTGPRMEAGTEDVS